MKYEKIQMFLWAQLLDIWRGETTSWEIWRRNQNSFQGCSKDVQFSPVVSSTLQHTNLAREASSIRQRGCMSRTERCGAVRVPSSCWESNYVVQSLKICVSCSRSSLCRRYVLHAALACLFVFLLLTIFMWVWTARTYTECPVFLQRLALAVRNLS